MNVRIIEFIGLIIIVAMLVSSGWYLRVLYDNKQELAYERSANEVATQLLDKESKVAKAVEDKLATFKVTERVIENERIKVVESNPTIYNVDCIDDAGLQYIKKIKSDFTNTRKSTN